MLVLLIVLFFVILAIVIITMVCDIRYVRRMEDEVQSMKKRIRQLEYADTENIQ